MPTTPEWLEADGLGGYASGTTTGIRSRRYHALLLVATTPPTGRFVLVNGIEAWVTTAAGSFALSAQHYLPDVIHPDGHTHIAAFTTTPWPTWTFALPDGTRIEQAVFVPRGHAATCLSWRLAAGTAATLHVRPLLSGRDQHALHHENPAFRFDADHDGERVTWRPYPGVPATVACTNGHYTHVPDWYRRFLYDEERARGLDHVEDLAAPGTFTWDLATGEATLVLASEEDAPAEPLAALRTAERRRRQRFPSPLARAADAYVVQGHRGTTIIAGYPWFTDWGRDTFIALPGLCLATGRLDDARAIVRSWAGEVSAGMLPNRFPDQATLPEFNAVDAALWYVVAVHHLLAAMAAAGRKPAARERSLMLEAIDAILDGYTTGTRHGIRADDDGLLAAGEPGVQLTWMDARVDGRVITPRIGKPVEIQALWLNALRIGSAFSERWAAPYARGMETFAGRFWNEARGCLYDVVDCDHQPGTVDPALRPNQILAVGGLPFPLLDGARARRVVDTVEATLLTPLGLRSLAPGEAGYTPRYAGGIAARDGAYHQGTVWPWLLAPFVDAWLRVRGHGADTIAEARARFLPPLEAHLDEVGLGHVSELADAEPPHTPGGCPFQAWSVAAALTLEATLR